MLLNGEPVDAVGGGREVKVRNGFNALIRS
jgi:hypothetical protein